MFLVLAPFAPPEYVGASSVVGRASESSEPSG